MLGLFGPIDRRGISEAARAKAAVTAGGRDLVDSYLLVYSVR